MSSLSVGLGLGQSQKLTPQMQQAIRLLQLSSLELEQEVQAKLDSNPLLERIEAQEERVFADAAKFDEWSANKESKSEDDGGTDDSIDGNDGLEELGNKLDGFDDDAMDSTWQDVYGDDVLAEASHDATEGQLPEQSTLFCIQDHIRWQMNFKKLSDMDALIAEHLIDSMDDDGLIRLDLSEVVQHFNTLIAFYELPMEVGEDEVLAVLRHIQSCSPTGVGGRDLSECLLLQLKALSTDTPYLAEAKQVLLYSEHLKDNNIKALIQETQLSAEQIKSALTLIRTLDPAPAQSFSDAQRLSDDFELPDILVIAKGTQKNHSHKAIAKSWHVALNPETLPQLGINKEYSSLIKRGDDSPTAQYLKENLQDAKLFIRSIEERNQNLLKVATCIVKHQQDFMLKGDMAMKPLTLREVADEIGVHESTVSRLTTNKTMLTPQGLYSLKYFFSSYVQGSEGEVSSTAIGAMIKQILENENPKKPLSDSAITKILVGQGVDIARRTVAKYREAVGILSSSERKQKL